MRKFSYFLHQRHKDIINYSLKLVKVFSQEPIPFKANTSFYSNASQYSGAIDACKNLVSSANRYRKTLQYYKLTDSQIHHLLKLQRINQICCNFQQNLIFADSISTANIKFSSMFNVFLANT